MKISRPFKSWLGPEKRPFKRLDPEEKKIQSYTDCLIHQSGVSKVNVTKIVQAGNKIILKMSILGVYQHNKKQIITS